MGQREPTGIDQLMLELINAARRNPALEANRLINGQLNEGVSLNKFITSTPKQPLAFNLYLNDSAYNHSKWMLGNDIFSHTGINNSTSQQRMKNAGYSFITPWGSGENIAWKGTTGDVNITQYVIDNYDNLFIDFNYEGRGHRVAILKDEFQEIGIASVSGIFSVNNNNYNSLMTTQNFAYSGENNAFLTGVIYDDAIIDDDFYTVGEGINNIIITAKNVDTGLTFQVKNWTSGGYSLALPEGAYNVSFIGNLDQDPQDDIITKIVNINKENVKVDIVTDDPLLMIIDPSLITFLNNSNNNSLLNKSIYRFQSLNNLGVYLYVEENESKKIQSNFPEFQLEGLAFSVGVSADDDLMAIYRFQNINLPGTYLYVGEEEANNIRQNSLNFQDEGLAFYVYPASNNEGDSIYRFQNINLPGTYLFVGEEEANNILKNFSNFVLEGIAFKVN